MRVHLSFSMLHPLYDALGFTWIRGKGMEVKVSARTAIRPERFITSPYYHLISNDLDHMRRRLDPATPSEFPIFDDLKKMGVTDYLAFRALLLQHEDQGMIGSWSPTRRRVQRNMIAELLRMQNHLAVATKMAVLSKLAGNMMTTYLGGEAGKRVLSGKIKRGEGDTIRSALVMGDMRSST